MISLHDVWGLLTKTHEAVAESEQRRAFTSDAERQFLLGRRDGVLRAMAMLSGISIPTIMDRLEREYEESHEKV